MQTSHLEHDHKVDWVQNFMFIDFTNRVCGVPVSRLLCMQKALGSIPSISILYFYILNDRYSYAY